MYASIDLQVITIYNRFVDKQCSISLRVRTQIGQLLYQRFIVVAWTISMSSFRQLGSRPALEARSLFATLENMFPCKCLRKHDSSHVTQYFILIMTMLNIIAFRAIYNDVMRYDENIYSSRNEAEYCGNFLKTNSLPMPANCDMVSNDVSIRAE